MEYMTKARAGTTSILGAVPTAMLS